MFFVFFVFLKESFKIFVNFILEYIWSWELILLKEAIFILSMFFWFFFSKSPPPCLFHFFFIFLRATKIPCHL